MIRFNYTLEKKKKKKKKKSFFINKLVRKKNKVTK